MGAAGKCAIDIKYKSVEEAVSKLSNISEQVASRNLKVSFAESEGMVVDEINNLVSVLTQLGKQYSEFYQKMANGLEMGVIEFKASDTREAGSIRK